MTKETPTRHDDTEATPITSRVDDGDIGSLEQAFRDRGVSYARATVVRREPPVSANVGDRAIVTAEGELYGWVGGAACAQSVVKAQAREVLTSGEAKLVGIAPDPDEVARPGLEAFPMTCHSEGVLEVFIEPVAPATRLAIVGGSPIAQSLARLAGDLSLEVTLVAPQEGEFDVPEATELLLTADHEDIAEAMGPDPLVVVASMGEFDARGIAAGVLAGARYIGLVASDDRATEEIDRAAGLLGRASADVRSLVTNPAGVDILARTPAGIAAAILAELVDVRSTTGTAAPDTTERQFRSPDEQTAVETGGSEDDASAEEPTGEAVDPVCGMTVETVDASATVEHGGRTYYFCCHGCADSFRNEPDAYLDGDVEAEP